MNFIKLTTFGWPANFGDRPGGEVYVDQEAVSVVQSMSITDKGKSTIHSRLALRSGLTVDVHESPDVVVAAIDDAAMGL